MSHKRIYLDYASTTPVDPAVEKEMRRFWRVDFGNPGSIHAEGLQAKKAVDEARTKIARLLHGHADEIVFTGSGTEANNLAIFGVAHIAFEKTKNWSKLHFMTSVIEHSSVLECFKELERRGAWVDYISVNEEGVVNTKELISKICSETVLVSIQYANSEIGTVQGIRGIFNQIKNAASSVFPKSARPIFHTDASQATQYLNISQDYLGSDLVTFDAQKIYGPKGIGALYVRRRVELKPLIFGGGQERGLRAGTENVPLIVGFAKAFELADARREKESARLTALRDYAIEKILKEIPKAVLNGALEARLPNNINISIPGLDAEFAVLKLDTVGIACATKSACVSSEEASYVIVALRKGSEYSHSSLRFSLGRVTKKSDIDFLCKALKSIAS